MTEKYIIARANQNNLLNKRTELASKCWHRNNCILKNIWHILNWCNMEQLKSYVQSQPTHRKCKGYKTGDTWHESNQYMVSKQGRKQIGSKQITGTMTCSKSTVNGIGVMQTKRHRLCMLVILDRSLSSKNICND